MSYTNVNGMRSTRYPLSAVGACSCTAPSLGATPQELATYIGVGTAIVGLGTLAVFLGTRRMRPNRRRRGRR